MSDLRTAAQMALESLEQLQGGCTDSGDGTVEAITVWCPEVIDALRAALASEPQPLAWRVEWGSDKWVQYHDEGDPLPESWDDEKPSRVVPLYTASATLKPLTDAQIDAITSEQWPFAIKAAYRAYARAIERALGIGGQA